MNKAINAWLNPFILLNARKWCWTKMPFNQFRLQLCWIFLNCKMHTMNISNSILFYYPTRLSFFTRLLTSKYLLRLYFMGNNCLYNLALSVLFYRRDLTPIYGISSERGNTVCMFLTTKRALATKNRNEAFIRKLNDHFERE